MSNVFSLLKSMFSASDPSATIAPQQASQRLKDPNPPQLIDVRSSGEHRAGHIPGSQLIPLPEFAGRLAKMDKSKPLLLYCQSGHRSGMALRMAKSNGFTAAHIAGGFSAWSRSGLPVK